MRRIQAVLFVFVGSIGCMLGAGAEIGTEQYAVESGASRENLCGQGLDALMQVNQSGFVPLRPAWDDLLADMKMLGQVQVLTSNHAMVHLSKGKYEPFEGGRLALVLDRGIDLRLFTPVWKHGVAIVEGPMRGFSFFNAAGVPMHRILLTGETDTGMFTALTQKYLGEKAELKPAESQAKATVALTPEVSAALLEDWRKLEDTHEFSRLLRRHKLSRLDAVRAARGVFSTSLTVGGYEAALRRAKETELPVMIFAINEGCTQIYTGPLGTVDTTANGLKVTGNDFELLVKPEHVSETWRVVKPTKKGPVESLELYDAQGEVLAYVFCSTKEPQEVWARWKSVLDGLPAVE